MTDAQEEKRLPAAGLRQHLRQLLADHFFISAGRFADRPVTITLAARTMLRAGVRPSWRVRIL